MSHMPYPGVAPVASAPQSRRRPTTIPLIVIISGIALLVLTLVGGGLFAMVARESLTAVTTSTHVNPAHDEVSLVEGETYAITLMSSGQPTCTLEAHNQHSTITESSIITAPETGTYTLSCTEESGNTTVSITPYQDSWVTTTQGIFTILAGLALITIIVGVVLFIVATLRHRSRPAQTLQMPQTVQPVPAWQSADAQPFAAPTPGMAQPSAAAAPAPAMGSAPAASAAPAPAPRAPIHPGAAPTPVMGPQGQPHMPVSGPAGHPVTDASLTPPMGPQGQPHAPVQAYGQPGMTAAQTPTVPPAGTAPESQMPAAPFAPPTDAPH